MLAVLLSFQFLRSISYCILCFLEASFTSWAFRLFLHLYQHTKRWLLRGAASPWGWNCGGKAFGCFKTRRNLYATASGRSKWLSYLLLLLLTRLISIIYLALHWRVSSICVVCLDQWWLQPYVCLLPYPYLINVVLFDDLAIASSRFWQKVLCHWTLEKVGRYWSTIVSKELTERSLSDMFAISTYSISSRTFWDSYNYKILFRFGTRTLLLNMIDIFSASFH